MFQGNNFLQKQLMRDWQKNQPAQAYLFSGPAHLGKFSLAWDFAKKLTGREKSNQDFLWIIDTDCNEEEEKEAPIDIKTIRAAVKNLNRMVPKDQWQVLIVNNAERMTPEAQNAFLKTLEENHPGNVVILVTHQEQRILPTILSRCRRLRFNLVAEEALLPLLAQTDLGQEEKNFIIFWAAGRPGLVCQLAEEEKMRKKYHAELATIRQLASASMAERLAWAEISAKNPKTMAEQLELLALFFRQAALGKKVGLKMDKNKALNILEKVLATSDQLKMTNANGRLLLEQVVLELV